MPHSWITMFEGYNQLFHNFPGWNHKFSPNVCWWSIPMFHLAGGLEHEFYDFPYLGIIIIPTDELIFLRGVGIPPTRLLLSPMFIGSLANCFHKSPWIPMNPTSYVWVPDDFWLVSHLPSGILTVGPIFGWLVETNLPTPMTGRVYVNLLEGIFQLFSSCCGSLPHKP